MPTNVTEADAFTALVPVPNDTEAANAASILQFVQPLANRTKYIKSRFWNYYDGGTFAPTAPTVLDLTAASFKFKNGTATVEDGTLSIAGTTSVNMAGTGVLNVGSTSRIAVAGGGTIDLSTGSRIRRPVFDGLDADGTYQVTAGGRIRIPNITADRIYTLGHTGAINGDEFDISIAMCANVTNTVTIKDGGTTLTVMKRATGWPQRFIAVFDGANWQPWDHPTSV